MCDGGHAGLTLAVGSLSNQSRCLCYKVIHQEFSLLSARLTRGGSLLRDAALRQRGINGERGVAASWP